MASPDARVLVVDDNVINREVLADQLRSLGYAVLLAEHGVAALERLRQGGALPDLILLDLQMPVMDGFEFLQRAKADPVLQSVPVIMLSAVEEVSSVVECIQAGAEDYLTKPCHSVLLEARLKRVLERKRALDRAQKLGRYTLQQKIGEGGMAEVYLASHEMLRRPTAMKILRRQNLTELRVALFQREVQMTCRLSHPNTVRVYDYGRTPNGTFYYVMEYLLGLTLYALRGLHGPVSPARAVHIIKQICGSLREAHGIGLVHRDIKPGNIMLCRQGGIADMVKVLDFGIVKAAEGADPVKDHGQTMGTPYFMAPECFQAPGRVDARTDLYAVGALAYFLITGRYALEAASLKRFLHRLFKEEAVPPAVFAPEAPSPVLSDLILRCLAKRRVDRPQSAHELYQGLSACPESGQWRESDADAWWDEHVTIVGAPGEDLDQSDPAKSLTVLVDLAARASQDDLSTIEVALGPR